jgi:lysyl-tRNA synthetase class 2
MIESIFQVTGVNFNNILDFKMAQQLAIKKGLEVPAYFDSVGHIITLFFEQFVEETLIQPTFVYDFPVIVSPLAKRKQDNPQFAERFELYINGMEYANAFGENNDPD